jgi:hypothetical protein
MGWSIGFDRNWMRDIGYGVPATCDHPDCSAKIDRGLAYVCAHQQPYGGEDGCGLYYCHAHLLGGMCERCSAIADGDESFAPPFMAKPDHSEWIDWKLTDPSWKQWRDENPGTVLRMIAARAEGNRAPIDVHQQSNTKYEGGIEQ